jgi:hypothetical protein
VVRSPGYSDSIARGSDPPAADMGALINIQLRLVKPLSWFELHRGSSVGIATGCGLDDRRGRSSSPGRVKNVVQTGCGSHSFSYRVSTAGTAEGA